MTDFLKIFHGFLQNISVKTMLPYRAASRNCLAGAEQQNAKTPRRKDTKIEPKGISLRPCVFAFCFFIHLIWLVRDDFELQVSQLISRPDGSGPLPKTKKALTRAAGRASMTHKRTPLSAGQDAPEGKKRKSEGSGHTHG
jgi:hypothetical protein